MTERLSNPGIVIRDLESIEELRKVPEIEQEVWEPDDRDVMPMTLLIAAKEAGSIVLGAFDGNKMVGMAFAFPGIEHGRVSFHSHMAAVLSSYQNLNLGYKLKLAQRDRALAMGVDEITWTFDPLRARNAYFNFAKLGVVSDRYKLDFYGRESSSTMHQNGTDRLWVRWELRSARVQQRLNSRAQLSELSSSLFPLLSSDDRGRPARSDLKIANSRERIGIEIPADIATIEEKDTDLAWKWRHETRWAFTECMRGGFVVVEFLRGVPGEQAGTYVLSKS
jgi:predicted GNAT superfamily acetyltransferase